jgi:hypothetical protein
MRILLVLATLVCMGLPVSASQLPPMPDLSAVAKERVAPLFDAYEKLNKELAALPPAKDTSERLLRLKRRDDLGRGLIRQIDFNSLPPADGQAAVLAAQIEVERNDIENQTQLKAMLPARGWFLKSELSPEANTAAWLIVQHATNSDIDLVRRVVSAMYGMLDSGEIQKMDFAMLADRVAVVDGVRQTFGTQMICDNFKWVLYPVADETRVEALRKEMGIDITLADQLAQFATRSCPTAKYAGPIPK